ncbi:MAG: MCE family protein [Acidobacteriota bacterium]|nr:MCE family protein [Acidobacteriota bacterium]
MPRTRSLAWSELKIGALTIVALFIAAMAIFLVTGGRGFFWQQYHLKTRFGNVAGLKPGSPVRLAGVEVGSVDSVQLNGPQVDVWMSVNNRYRPDITTASVATLGSVSLLGESAVDITPSRAGQAIPDWGYVTPGEAPTQIADVTTQANRGLEQLNDVLKGIRNGQGTIGKLVTDDQLYRNLNAFVAAAHDVTAQLAAGKGSLGELLKNPQTARSLQASLQNLEAVTARLNAGQGSIGQLLKDDSFARSLTATTGNLRTLTGDLKEGKGTAGKLFTDAALYNRLDSLSSRLDSLVANLNAGEGTAGQLLKDRQLYENINQTVTEVRNLVQDIRKDPKKFLTVRVSIF